MDGRTDACCVAIVPQTSGLEHRVLPQEFADNKQIEWLFPDSTKNLAKLKMQFKARSCPLCLCLCLCCFLFPLLARSPNFAADIMRIIIIILLHNLYNTVLNIHYTAFCISISGPIRLVSRIGLLCARAREARGHFAAGQPAHRHNALSRQLLRFLLEKGGLRVRTQPGLVRCPQCPQNRTELSRCIVHILHIVLICKSCLVSAVCSYIHQVAELAKSSPELIQLLELHAQFASVATISVRFTYPCIYCTSTFASYCAALKDGHIFTLR